MGSYYGSTRAICAGGLVLSLMSFCADADNARDWQNMPQDLDLVFGYYSHVEANTSLDTSVPIDGSTIKADVYILRYAHSFAIDGRSSGFQILQPYADIRATLDDAMMLDGEHKRHGMGDTQFILVHNLFGAPALSREEFAKWQPETFLSAAFWLTAPTGDYDKDRLINIGANRWVFKPELAFGKPIGPTWIEVNTWVSLYTNNDDYLGNQTLAQRPQWAIEGHYSYNFNQALWASIDTTWSVGGETKIDGAPQDNRQNNNLLGATIGFQLSPEFGGLIAYSDTVQKRSYSPDVSNWTVRFQYVW